MNGEDDYKGGWVYVERMAKEKCAIIECDRLATGLKDFCLKHQDRFKRLGDPTKTLIQERNAQALCSVIECGKQYYCKGYCQKHYSRWQRSQQQSTELVNDGLQGCLIKDCNGIHHSHGYCEKHAKRVARHGDPLFLKIREQGTGSINNKGYLVLKIDGVDYLQHRLVMEESIGRKLVDGENVHHRNGDRLDNRIENLELWNRQQPSGQRVEDKIQYAIEILTLYAPEKLR